METATLDLRRQRGARADAGAHSRPDGSVVLVSHAFTPQRLLSKALATPLTHRERVRHHTGAITVLRFHSGPPTLLTRNDLCHLCAKGSDLRS